jgi:hypothetical protein
VPAARELELVEELDRVALLGVPGTWGRTADVAAPIKGPAARKY